MTVRTNCLAAGVAALAALTFSASSPAHAWECAFETCPIQCDLPLTYAVGTLPTELDETEALAEIAKAFDAWNAAECGGDLGFTYAGRFGDTTETPDIVIDTLDPWDAQYGSSDTTNSTAVLSTRQDGCMAAAGQENILLNGEKTWEIGGELPAVDLYTTVLSHVGQHLGIAGSSGTSSVVRRIYDGPVTGGIGSTDEDAICYLYGDGDVEPDNLVAGPTPVLDNCTICEANSDCSRGTCGPLFGDDFDSVCYDTCEDDTDCPTGATCRGERVKVCYDLQAADSIGCPADGPSAAADMGGGEPDMGTGSEPDAGNTGTDMGGDNVDDELAGSGCCAVADGSRDGSFLMIVLAGLGLFIRRRR